MDVSEIEFDRNEQMEAAAEDASAGIRLLLLGFFASVAGIGFIAWAGSISVPGAVFAAAAALVWITSALGAYGAYLTASALEWPGVATAIVVIGALLPYLQLILLLVLLGFSLGLVRRAGYRVGMFGALHRRVQA